MPSELAPLLKPTSAAALALAAVVISATGVHAEGLGVTRVSARSTFAAGCAGPGQTGTNHRNASVEPSIASDPRDSRHLVGAWQQGRWSDAGANEIVTGVSTDGGVTWARTTVPFAHCEGGNRSNGGDYERATDPWVTIGPGGGVYESAITFDVSTGRQAMEVSRSGDGGARWSSPVALTKDNSFDVILDKDSITADQTRPGHAYAVWDRLSGLSDPTNKTFRGPTYFARTTNGGLSWEAARIIYDPGSAAQTFGNQIAVLPNGDLVDTFTLFPDANGSKADAAVVRSSDQGRTWSKPTIISSLTSVPVTDPKTGAQLRTGDIVIAAAVDSESGKLFVTWQDARFGHGTVDGIVLSRSEDGGRRWSAPAQVNSVHSAQAFNSTINVNNDGSVGILYSDLRNDTTNPGVLFTNYWLARSDDGGETWREHQVGGTFDFLKAPDLFLGDYMGLSASLEPLVAIPNPVAGTGHVDIYAGVTGAGEN
jgi:BNR repeat-like domain